MKYRLTIKRVSSVIPTIVLLALLLFIGAAIWLCTIGLPDCALRAIERAAAERGIYLHIGGLRISPSAGFAIRGQDLRLYVHPDDEQPLAEVPKALVTLSFSRLLVGSVAPTRLQLVNGSISLPAGEAGAPPLPLTGIQADIIVTPRERRADGDLRLLAAGIPINISCDLTLPPPGEERPSKAAASAADSGRPGDSAGGDASEQTEESDDFETQLAGYIAQAAPIVDEINAKLRNQRWTDESRPSIAAEASFAPGNIDATVDIHVPLYETRDFHFRDAEIHALVSEDVITINSMRFKTVDPDSSVSLRAACSIPTRSLSFRLRSTSALIPIARKALKNPPPLLAKFNHDRDNAPEISLSGDLTFDPDNQLEHARVLATLEQHNLHVGQQLIDELNISFTYNDGDFNFDNLEASYGGGSLNLSAHSTKGSGDISATGRVPVAATLALISEFTSEPVTLPDQLEIGDMADIELSADISVPFREGEMLTFDNTIPYLSNLDLRLGTSRLLLPGIVSLTDPSVSISLRGIKRPGDSHIPQEAASLDIRAEADQATVLKVKALPEISAPELHSHFTDIGMSDFADPSTLKLSLGTNTLKFSSLHLGELSCGATTVLTRNLGALLSRERAQQYTLPPLLQARIDGISFMNSPACDATLALLPEETASAGSLELTLLQRSASNETPEPGAAPGGADSPAPDTTTADSAALTAAPVTTSTVATADAQAPASLDETTGATAPSAAPAASEAASSPARRGTLSLHYNIDPEHSIELRDIKADLPLADFAPLFNAVNASVKEIELPDALYLSGELSADLEHKRIRSGKLSLTVPHLVRNSCAVPALRGQSEAVALKLDLSARTPAKSDELVCKGKLSVDHESGSFAAEFHGSPQRGLSLTGRSDIRLDVLNRLIDIMDVNAIICDFKLDDQSKTIIDNIDLTVDYAQGLAVQLDCDVTLDHIGYQLGAYRLPCDQQGNYTGDQWLRSDLGPDPFVRVNRATCHVNADISEGKKRADGSAEADRCTVSILNPVLVFNNRPWMQRHKFRFGPEESTLSGEKVVLDLEANSTEIFKVRGNVYPAYSLGIFYAELFSIMEDMSIPYPVEVTSDYCLFPNSERCKRAMTGTIRCCASTPITYDLGVEIPLEDFSGFIRLSDDFVTLDHLNAGSWGGSLDAIIRVGISGPKTTLDGYLKASNMDLSLIAKSLDSEQNFALCNGFFRFQAASPELTALQGYGHFQATSGNLMRLQVFRPVSELLTDLPDYVDNIQEKMHTGKKPSSLLRSVAGALSTTSDVIDGIGNTATRIPFANHFIKYSLTDAYTNFDIVNGHFITRNGKALGCNLNVALQLDLNLVDMTLHGNLWPKINSIPTIILSPITVLSDFMFDIVVDGPVDDLSWSLGLDAKLKNKETGKEEHQKVRLPSRRIRQKEPAQS